LVLSNKSYKNAWYVLQTLKADVYRKSQISTVFNYCWKAVLSHYWFVWFLHLWNYCGTCLCGILYRVLSIPCL